MEIETLQFDDALLNSFLSLNFRSKYLLNFQKTLYMSCSLDADGNLKVKKKQKYILYNYY